MIMKFIINYIKEGKYYQNFLNIKNDENKMRFEMSNSNGSIKITNIILINLDGLRIDRVTKLKTFDLLKKESYFFENMHTVTPYTFASHYMQYFLVCIPHVMVLMDILTCSDSKKMKLQLSSRIFTSSKMDITSCDLRR